MQSQYVQHSPIQASRTIMFFHGFVDDIKQVRWSVNFSLDFLPDEMIVDSITYGDTAPNEGPLFITANIPNATRSAVGETDVIYINPIGCVQPNTCIAPKTHIPLYQAHMTYIEFFAECFSAVNPDGTLGIVLTFVKYLPKK